MVPKTFWTKGPINGLVLSISWAGNRVRDFVVPLPAQWPDMARALVVPGVSGMRSVPLKSAGEIQSASGLFTWFAAVLLLAPLRHFVGAVLVFHG